MWQPEKRGDNWVVVKPETPQEAPRIIMGGNGMPLTFWNEKSAQLRADAANRRGE